MKALCLKQPYATWVAEEGKTIETRSWQTHYRGRFLVVASRSQDLLTDFDVEGISLLFRGASGALYVEPSDYPRGVALAIANLVNCRPMTKADEEQTMCGLYQSAWAWLLNDVKRIEPFPVKGQLSFFEVLYQLGQRRLVA
jgi:hypothetical protein